MYLSKKPLSTLFFIFFIYFSLVSCSKDNDLLSEYVIADVSENAEDYIEIVYYYQDQLLIDPNDSDSNSTIIGYTEPTYGEVVINSDNTLTYTLENEEVSEDEFTYTTESTTTSDNEETSTQTETTNVKIISVSDEVDYWKQMFDEEWVDDDYQVDSIDALEKAQSKNINQEYYYLGYYIDGLVKIWQATGDNDYLDEALSLINITVDDAVDLGNGYLGWPNNENDGYALWDSFYWRYVSTLLRIMYQSPNLRATGNYQQQYEELLEFSEKNIWERYETLGVSNFYRINTHMSSHWARIGMELYIITGKEKYKTVFDNISYGTMVDRPSNLRNQFKYNSQVPTAYTWSQRWDIDQIQDTSHAGAIVSFVITAYENDMYWDKADIDALISTVKDVIWKEEYETQFMYNVDGTGGYDLHGRLHDWLNLGRYDESLQQRIKDDYTGKNLTFYGIQPLGIAALNAKILEDGQPVYPEQ